MFYAVAYTKYTRFCWGYVRFSYIQICMYILYMNTYMLFRFHITIGKGLHMCIYEYIHVYLYINTTRNSRVIFFSRVIFRCAKYFVLPCLTKSSKWQLLVQPVTKVSSTHFPSKQHPSCASKIDWNKSNEIKQINENIHEYPILEVHATTLLCIYYC